MSLLDVRDLSIGFHMPGRDVQVVDRVSFSLEQSETLAIVGESGSGKTQTAFSLMGLLAKNGYSTGSGRFDGQELPAEGKDLLRQPHPAEANTA